MKPDFRLLAVLAIIAVGGACGPAFGADFRLVSTTVRDGATMPSRTEYRGYGCEGGNIAPDLHWSGVPAGTKSFVLTVHDPDAPAPGGWWHWVRYNIKARFRGLPSGDPVGLGMGSDGTQSFGEQRYGGPCPPSGDRPHHYVFVLRALDIGMVPGATPRTTGPQLERLVRGHVLGEARLTGRFGRPRF
jgi:Raf kinase inhibitor-like YbhB/YbcL family protein